MKLIIVNDEKLTAQTMLKEINWENLGITEVFLAYDAKEAREIIKREAIDIALCDIEMPGESGISLLRWIREEEFGKKYCMECIFLTCHANFSYAHEALRLGCQDYVLMPARYEDIEKAVQRVVNRKKEMLEEEKLKGYGQRWINNQRETARQLQGENKAHSEIVMECRQFIMEHLRDGNLTVNDVAAYCYMNAIYLNRIFKKEQGISISQYITRERMDLAARLLLDKDLNANTVAYMVGYSNYPHFSTTFKKCFGYSPVQFKENQELKGNRQKVGQKED